MTIITSKITDHHSKYNNDDDEEEEKVSNNAQLPLTRLMRVHPRDRKPLNPTGPSSRIIPSAPNSMYQVVIFIVHLREQGSQGEGDRQGLVDW